MRRADVILIVHVGFVIDRSFCQSFSFPVSIIPQMLPTHSSIYHPRCITFFSRYFSFPVSIIPPLLHNYSSIYLPRCITFFCRYFSFPCQYHSTIAPYSFIHLPPTLYNVFLPVLQFPLYHSTIASYSFIHLPPTLYVSLPVLQFSPVSTFHHSSTLNFTHYHRCCVMLATDSILT